MVGGIPAAGEEVVLRGSEARHAAVVLRLRAGDRLDLLDGAGVRAEAVAREVRAGRRECEVVCRVVCREARPEPSLAVRLYLAPPRGGAMGDAVRCATELGVRRITPILCRHGVSRPGPEAATAWRQDAVAAAKQSGNPFLPVVDTPCLFADALREASLPAVFGAVVNRGPIPVPRPAAGVPLGVWVGPEGGFCEEEENALLERGVVPVTAGPWVLRVGTAVAALLGGLWREFAHA